MITKEVIAQIIGIVAMAMNCISYVQKKQTNLLVFQMLGGMLFSINYFLLGALSGAFLNISSFIRAIIFIKKDKFNAKHPAWTVGFIAVYFISYALIFTVFDKEPLPINFILEILPVFAMIATLISYRYGEAKIVRRFGLISSPLWLTYNIANFSIGAIACEIFSLISIVIGIVKYDIKPKSIENK